MPRFSRIAELLAAGVLVLDSRMSFTYLHFASKKLSYTKSK